MKIYVFSLIAIIVIAPFTIIAKEPPNYCLDPEVNAKWSKMLNESPQDNLLIELFALRIGLCELVKRNLIHIDRATEIFEKNRNKGINKRKSNELRQKLQSGGNT